MKKILILALASILIIPSFAQNTLELSDSSNLRPRNFDNQYDYENFLSPFPARKKDNWSVGLDFGSAFISGDIQPFFTSSYGASLKIRKSVNHILSFQFQSLFAQMQGYDYRPRNIDGNVQYLNYRTRVTDHSLQGVISLNSINYHRRNSKVLVKLFGGLGYSSIFTQSNYLDDNGNPYDYSDIARAETYADRRFVANQQINLLDDSYETVLEPRGNEGVIGDTRFLPSFNLGMGLDLRLCKRLDLALESRVSRHFTDKLDGAVLGTGEDWLIYSSIGLNVKIGKGTEPRYWVNPLEDVYSDVMALKQTQDPSTSFQDIDQDGVVDIIDRDLNSPIGAEVTTTGESADTDKDGVPNYRDKEAGTPDGAKVDAFGRAIDLDMDGVPDINDLELNTPQNAFVDVKGREIVIGNQGGGTVNNILFMKGVDIWTIFFDTDDYTVKADYHPIILNLASYMLDNPSAEVILTGYTDSRSSAEYNLALSKKRANSVKSKFEGLGIDGNRFEIQYKGEEDPLIETNDNASGLRSQLNRRVTLKLK